MFLFRAPRAKHNEKVLRTGAAPAPPIASDHVTMDRALQRLAEGARSFAQAPLADKRKWLAEVRAGMRHQAEAWARAACEARGAALGSATHAEAWLSGPGLSVRSARLLEISLAAVERRGRLPVEPLGRTPSGSLRVGVTPADWVDRVCFPGVMAETRLDADLEPADIPSYQATFHHQRDPEGGVAVVLGAGNVDSIAPMDVFYKMFVEGRVVALKPSPVNSYLVPTLERAFAPLIERGYLAIVGGGAEVGTHLVDHALVESVHMTGSQGTHDAIVWGVGDEAKRRKQRGTPRLDKPITSELGNVSPVIVVPCDYTSAELEWVAQGIVGMFIHNASMNCNAAKVLVLPASWSGRGVLMRRVREMLSETPTRPAWYPNVREVYERLLGGAPRVEKFGSTAEGELAWALVPDLGPGELEGYLTEEPFCPILSEVVLPQSDPLEFIDAAVTYANSRVPGTLNCSLYVKPSWTTDPAKADALEESVDRLRYGTVAVNTWGAFGYGLGSTPWGGYPGGTLRRPSSGIGWVHNAPMLERIEKCVVWGVLRGIFKPVWYPSHRDKLGLGRYFSAHEGGGGLPALVQLAVHAVRG